MLATGSFGSLTMHLVGYAGAGVSSDCASVLLVKDQGNSPNDDLHVSFAEQNNNCIDKLVIFTVALGKARA
jgi:hypothetical protein